MRPFRAALSARDREGGFTLIETLVAMTILAVGGVSVIALFAAAVQLMYQREMNEKVLLAQGPATIEAQARVDRPVIDPRTKREIGPEFHFTYFGFSWVRPWPGATSPVRAILNSGMTKLPGDAAAGHYSPEARCLVRGCSTMAA